MSSLLAILASFAALVVLALPAAAVDAPAAGGRCFEMRTYTSAPGKFDAMHSRFRDHTNALFVKHGMTLVGYWTPTDGETAANTMVYILAYPDRAAADASWKAFRADPVWIKAKADSEVNGQLVDKVVSVFLKPTDYSPIR